MRAMLCLLSLSALGLTAACSADDQRFTRIVRDGGGATGDVGPVGPCDQGRVYCNGNERYTCDAAGQIVDRQACVAPAGSCVPNVGCRTCTPGASRCNPASPQQVQTCSTDGARWIDGATCNAANGESCNSGVCVDRCSASSTGRSYLGCDYWPTVTSNTALDPRFSFAVVLSNPQGYEVHATITGGALTAPREVDLAPGAIETINLPWVSELVQLNPANRGCRADGSPCPDATASPASSVIRRGGAYHVRSNGPIAAYQFNPLTYERTGGYFSFTNDASLLLPQGVLTRRYLVSTWPNVYSALSGETVGGFVSIVAVTGETTEVTVRPTGNTSAGPGVPAMRAGQERTFTLNAGDVLQLSGEGAGDLTGTAIESNQPIAVFVGHDCATVPAGRPACDHLEEQLFPNETWGRDYVVSALRDRGPGVPALVRIVSQADGNQLTFDPPSARAAVTLQAGQMIEFQSNVNFRVTGTGALLVSQFMLGQGPAGSGLTAGDPAMVFEVPVQQYRTSYDFYVPQTYPQNFINVVAPAGTELIMDDMPFRGSMSPVGTMSVFTLPITSGPHRLRSSNGQPIGVKVYGIARYTSYMYPGGLDLQLITPG
ncbi:MAG: IgGFc-binding protein [Deltaproteobacteria bacterium]|nr:IgGFc-binding protein [Myxococcales bacterium]MDP3218023.1 IgGFc-binding protein [Deltaproteobacteria bacterium]